jgi:hypothetical protein
VAEELAMLPKSAADMALGTIAHNAVLMELHLHKANFAFKHGAQHLLPNGATFSIAAIAAVITSKSNESRHRCLKT